MTALLIAIALLAYTGGILAFSRGPIYLNSNILGAIINFIATLVPASIFFLVASQRFTPSEASGKGYIWAVAGGVCIGMFTLAMTKLFSDGNNVSFVAPLVYGGAVLLSSAAGVLLFKEKLGISQASGMLIIVVGILLVSYSTWKETI